MTSSVYATNVFHHNHVIEAMRQANLTTSLVRRPEVPGGVIGILNRVPAAAPISRVIARRQRIEYAPEVNVHNLGLRELIHPLSARVPGLSVTPSMERRLTAGYAKRVARCSACAHLLQYVDGLGHVAIATNPHLISIMERRNLHHKDFESEIEVYNDFPFEPTKSPIGEMLDYEYENSTKIVVYSEVAKNSLTHRGIPADKIVRIPLPAHGAQRASKKSDDRRMRNKFLYVGRIDAYKGIDVAVATVQALGTPCELHVAGPASDAAAGWLRRQPGVIYHGILNRQELKRLYCTSECMLLPSIESFGFVAFEAISAGLPIVVRETTGAAEYLTPRQAKVVRGRELNSWCNAVSDVRADFLGMGLEDQERNLPETISEIVVERRLNELYRSLLSDHQIA